MAAHAQTSADLFYEKLGHEPVLKLGPETPFHFIILYLFWKVFQAYGQAKSFTVKHYGGYDGAMFVLDPEKTGGVEGCFICKPGGQARLSYSLYYFNYKNPDFSEQSRVQHFPNLTISAGYVSWGGNGFSGFATEDKQLIPGKYLASINVFGPKIESQMHLSEFNTELFLLKIITEDYLSEKTWMKTKANEIRHLK